VRNGSRWLAILGGERGALLWLPALLGAAWLVLFALRIAPHGQSLFTRTTGLRVALWASDSAPESARLRSALATRLRHSGEITVVDSTSIRGVVHRFTPAVPETTLARLLAPQAQVAIQVTAVLESGAVRGHARAFDVRARRWVLEVGGVAASPDSLAAVLADSLRDLVFIPEP
jgi:hypothetical protein